MLTHLGFVLVSQNCCGRTSHSMFDQSADFKDCFGAMLHHTFAVVYLIVLQYLFRRPVLQNRRYFSTKMSSVHIAGVFLQADCV